MMKNEHLVKIILIIFSLIIIFLVWFSFKKFDEKLVIIDELTDENERNKGIIERLEKTRESNDLAPVEANEESKIKEVVNVFLQSVYTVSEDNYDERKEDAKIILNDSLYEMIFGGGKSKVEYSYQPSDIHIYVSIESEKKASSFVTFEKKITDLDNNSKNYSFVTLEIQVTKQGEHWIINEFKEIHEEPI